MAVTLNASASAGLITTADTSTILQLQTGGTTAVTVDASQNVGIGTNSPPVKVTVVGNIKAGYEAATGLIIGTPSSLPSNDVNAYVFWSTNAVFGANNGDLVYVPRTSTSAYHRFFTGNGGAPTEKVSITNSGILDIGTGAGAVGQIQFPATQVASANANTLDDYEEGTWTPALAIGGSTTGITYAIQQGRYVKIGKTVIACFHIELTSKGGLTGILTVAGLPFPQFTSRQFSGSPVVCETGGSGTWPTGLVYGMPWSDSNVYIRYENGTGYVDTQGSMLTNSGKFFWTGVYEASN